MTVYRWLFDHALVRVDPETAHRAGFGALRAARPVLRSVTTGQLSRLGSRIGGSGVTRGQLTGSVAQPVRAMGIEFHGLLGLAAGFDKNAEGIDALAALGFGFVEVGTVTGEPQPGNPRPRLFRLPKDRAVVNRMGFNNDGAEAVAERLARRRLKQRASGSAGRVVVGVNIGKTKAVPEDDIEAVIADYEKSTRLLAPYADYLVVNVSSPNTPGLRDLQSTERLRPLLEAVRRTADSVTSGPAGPPGAGSHSRRVPLLVKIAPDLADADVLAVADLAVGLGLDGIVATNTTISRDGLVSTPAEVERAGAGGLSGAPLRARALEVLGLLRERVGPEMTIIGVGGIGSAADARERLEAGATLLQAYTAFVYEGAGWPRRVQRELAGA